MSDKGYTPASGESFEARRSTSGWSVRRGEEKPSEHFLELEAARIDHRTQRVVSGANGTRRLFWIYEQKGKRILSWPGGSIELDASELLERKGTGGGKLRPLKLTMPGKVVSVKVKEGDIVQTDQGLLVVEAMKMENLLLAPGKARVGKIHVSEGDRLESGATLITFESAD
ncbi:MAG: acetyl-CoA carboxylase biotin carboxyl carrier protein subunit [Bdellovibrionota bacterium]